MKDDNDLSSFHSFFETLNQEHLDHLTQTQKLIIWINLYNSIMQLELKKMEKSKVNRSIFSKPVFTISGQPISLDFIEHGILRKNKFKYGFGYFPGLYLNSISKKWAISILDARIHFQLNCGATSCPVIRVLTEENIEHELIEGEKDFILSETEVNHTKKKLLISQLFLFYKKDFGGTKNRRKLINQYIPLSDYSLKFKKWDWNIQTLKIK